jgi:hypothetical protein
VTHKEEEWFKQKYHPDDSTLRKEELKVLLNVIFIFIIFLRIRIHPRPGSFFFSDRVTGNLTDTCSGS